MKALILAGGSGTRLWPASRNDLPKQFLKIIGGESLLKQTCKRLEGMFSFNEIYVVTSSDYLHEVKKELKEIPERNILLEPEKRSTLPAIAFALKILEEKEHIEEDEVIFVTPADHIMAPKETFHLALKEGEKEALKGSLVTFGVHPNRPETGYGYIKAKGNLVEAFVEKPTLEKAQSYLLSGEYFWNSGCFAFTIKTMKEEMARHAPLIAQKMQSTSEEMIKTFAQLPVLSIDYGICEKSDRVRMVNLNLTWSDVGSWENVYEMLEKNENGNSLFGEVITLETENSLVLSEKSLIATIGVQNLLIIETEDALLVAQKEKSQKVKEIVAELIKRGKKEAASHLTAQRPWGSYTVLKEASRYKIKRIEVKPKEKLSLQLHYHRSEHWIVVTGTAQVTIEGAVKLVHEGESIFVPKSAMHRVENPGIVPLVIIEVQVGEYLGEDDIVRFEDIYGRSK